MSALSPGETVNVHITGYSTIADGLCLGDWGNISRPENDTAPDIPIHVSGDVQTGDWYHVTVTEVSSSHMIAEADYQVDPQSGQKIGKSMDNTRKVWWVDTQGAECFHTSQSCDMLENREGPLLSRKVGGRNKPLPEELSGMRRCSYCH